MGEVASLTWQEIAARKQAERATKLPSEWLIPASLLPPPEQLSVQDFPATSGFFTEREIEITNSTATDVVAKIASGEWTALEVLKAVCKRATVAQQLVNCLSEIYFEEAFKIAAELDEFYKKEGKTVGPLHGLPISLKDQFNLPGVDSTIGYAGWAFKPHTTASESTLVTLLRSAGAVLFTKTNIPTTLMMGESVNNLFGRTLHPCNRELSSGGSSGGESALVSFGGSFLGVGTDIGGSIRNPASFTGLYALRPSHGRVSYQQATNTFLGQEAVRSCVGPMARDPADVRLFMKALAEQRGWELDPQVVPLPWREEQEKLPEKLCFGWGMGDGVVTPTPPLRRAMEHTKAALLAAGHSVIDFVPYETKDAAEIITRMWTADGAEEVHRDAGLTGEPLPLSVENYFGKALGDGSPTPQTVFETWQNQHRKAVLAQSFLAHWQATAKETGTGRPIDALIMPATPFPAPRHDTPYRWNYSVLSPLLDLTTGVFPVTKVDVEKDRVPEGWEPISEKDREIMLELYEKPENHENAPIGLQLIGKRLEEEKITALLQVMKDVVGVDY